MRTIKGLQWYAQRTLLGSLAYNGTHSEPYLDTLAYNGTHSVPYLDTLGSWQPGVQTEAGFRFGAFPLVRPSAPLS